MQPPISDASPQTTSSRGAKPRPCYLALLTTAFLLRLAIATTYLYGDTQQKFFNQATELGRLAVSLLNGNGLSSPFGGDTGPSAFLTPGYPAFIAAIFGIFGPYTKSAAAAILLLQVLFGVFTVFTIMHVANKLFGTRAANVAGAIWALSPPLLFFPTLFWESGLSTLLLIAFLAFSLYCTQDKRPRNWPALGAFGALIMLVNPSLMFALLSIAAWALYRCRTTCRRAPLIVFATWLILLAPWPIRNARVLHAFIPARTNLGYELWQGNRPESTGGFTPALHPNVSREEFARYAQLGELGYMREKSDIAKQAIRANPARFLRLTLERSAKFWIGLGTHDPSALVVTYITAGSILALAGLALLFRRNRILAYLFLGPLVLFPLPYYLTHPDFRFRLILDPLTTILTAYALTHWRTPAKEEEAGERPPLTR